MIMRMNPQKMKKITVVMKERLVDKLNDVCNDTEEINRSELIQLFCEYGLDNIDEILPEYESDNDDENYDDEPESDEPDEDDDDSDEQDDDDDNDDDDDDDQEDDGIQDDYDDDQDDED